MDVSQFIDNMEDAVYRNTSDIEQFEQIMTEITDELASRYHAESSNSDYTKCIECDEQKQLNPYYSYCPNCGMRFV